MAIWKPVEGYARYEVSDDGRVRNTDGRELARRVRENGYVTVGLHCRGKGQREFRVHRLVAAAFIPNPEQKPEVNHKDCDRANNQVANLEWVTRYGNVTHANDAGRRASATNPKVPHALSADDVMNIRVRYAAGETAVALGKVFGVGPGHISRVAKGVLHKGAGGPIAGYRKPLQPRRPGPNAERDARIYALASEPEASQSQIAREFGLTPRQVWRIVAKHREYAALDVLAPTAPAQRPPPKNVGSKPRKMTPAKVIELRRMRAAGISAEECAQHFGITIFTTYKIARGHQWKNVPMEPFTPPQSLEDSKP